MLAAGTVVERKGVQQRCPIFPPWDLLSFVALFALSQEFHKGYFSSYHTQAGTMAGP